MKILRIDSVGGASGDMLLGALLGLAPEALTPLQDAIENLLPHHCKIHFAPVIKNGITGFQATVELLADPHETSEHHHADNHAAHHHHHAHHHWSEIRNLIAQSTLPEAVKRDALGVFSLLAAAEAKVHGKPVDEVAFHEVGAVDSIVDIVGNCFLYHYLHIDALECAPLPTGFGTVHCAHGVLPIPAPATAELLTGGKLSVFAGDEAGELLTPTGAALLSYFVSPAHGNLQLLKAANSFGQRELKNGPNLLRATVAETPKEAAERETIWELASNLDDMTGEQCGALSDQLFAAGAVDCFYSPLTMKKSRPGVRLGVLCRREDREKLLKIIFQNSSALGVRYFPVERAVLSRKTELVSSRWGELPVKAGFWGDDLCSVKVEYENARRIAERENCSLAEVQAEGAVLFRKELKK